MDKEIQADTLDKFDRYIKDPDKSKPEYFNMNKRAEILNLEKVEDLEEFKEYLIDNKKINNHFKIINYLKTDAEQRTHHNQKTDNSYNCKFIGTTEQKQEIIKRIERDHEINIKNDIINNNTTEIKFNPDLYKLIVNVFQFKQKQPKKLTGVVNMYIDMLKHTYGDIISAKKLKTKENRDKQNLN